MAQQAYRVQFDNGKDEATVICPRNVTVQELLDLFITQGCVDGGVRGLSCNGRMLGRSDRLPPPPGPIRCITRVSSELPRAKKRAEILKARSEYLWEQREFTDATVACESARYPVHRGVLAAASPVLRRAFASGLSEAVTAEYTIQGSSPPAVESMLRFCYTGYCPKEEAVLVPLLELAIMYEVDGLVEAVAPQLLDGITPENVAARGRLLKSHADHVRIKEVWAAYLRRVADDVALIAPLV